MPNFFLNFNVLRSQAQLKGWSNRPDVPLGSSRWRRKISKTSSSKPSPPPPTTTTTTTTATASSSSRSTTERSSSFKPTTTPTTASSRSSVSWTGSTTNVLLIHPLCRCCTDVVNSITRPYKRRLPKVTTTTTTMTNSSGSSSNISNISTTTTSTTTTAAGSSGMKQTWDGFPSTQYMRLWPQPDEEKLWEAKFRPERNRVATLPDPPKKKQTKKQRSWKFWPTSIL